MSKRQIIRIDQEKCDGCGACVPSCAEGAIQIVDGKAALLADKFCDGLGACLGECPRGALTIEAREAGEFEGPAPAHEAQAPSPLQAPEKNPEPGAFVCPGSRLRQFERPAAVPAGASALGHWPVKLKLVAPKSPFLKGAHLLVAADCAPFAAGDFHARFLQGKAVVCGCPKFEDEAASVAKLTAILAENQVREITIVNMEVPCCHGLVQVVRRAMAAAGRTPPVTICTLAASGELLQQQKVRGE